MNQPVIDRLKEEKAMSKKNYYNNGVLEGRLYAESASYDELLHVVESEEGAICVENVFQDEVLEEYFRDLFTDSPVPDAHASDFIAGWVAGVHDFWGEVEPQL